MTALWLVAAVAIVAALLIAWQWSDRQRRDRRFLHDGQTYRLGRDGVFLTAAGIAVTSPDLIHDLSVAQAQHVRRESLKSTAVLAGPMGGGGGWSGGIGDGGGGGGCGDGGGGGGCS